MTLVLVARIMQRKHLQGIVRKRYKATTDCPYKLPVAENVLDREFPVSRENMAWVSDITYIATGEGWLYLTTVIDLFDRKVIGWAFSGTMKAGQTRWQLSVWLPRKGPSALFSL